MSVQFQIGLSLIVEACTDLAQMAHACTHKNMIGTVVKPEIKARRQRLKNTIRIELITRIVVVQLSFIESGSKYATSESESQSANRQSHPVGIGHECPVVDRRTNRLIKSIESQRKVFSFERRMQCQCCCFRCTIQTDPLISMQQHPTNRISAARIARVNSEWIEHVLAKQCILLSICTNAA